MTLISDLKIYPVPFRTQLHLSCIFGEILTSSLSVIMFTAV